MNARGITACLICYNEMFWLPLTLPPMLKFSDQLVVVEGSPDGHSTDGTLEFLEEHLRRSDMLVTDVPCSWQTYHNWDINMRNAYLPFVEYSHVLMIDADEAYTEEGWRRLRVDMEVMYRDGAVWLLHHKYHFYKDLQHRITIGSFAAGAHSFWEYDSGARYKDISTIPYIGGSLLTHRSHLQDTRLILWHYGHASPSELYKRRKAKFQYRVDGGSHSPEQVQAWMATWKDDRDLAFPGVVACEDPHPLAGVDLDKEYERYEKQQVSRS